MRTARPALVLPLVLGLLATTAGAQTPEPKGQADQGARRRSANTGATAATERAVLDGLRWLARHQNPDGSWSPTTLRERCACDHPSYAPQTPYSGAYDEGVTGLALLCFLGLGFHHESPQDLVDPATGKRHEVGRIVRGGLDRLVARQDAAGSFTRGRPYNYNEAIATTALCEAFGLTQDGRLFRPARRALAFLEAAQRPSPAGAGAWGWHYLPRSAYDRPAAPRDPEREKALFRADLSNTGWSLMALVTGRHVELPVREESLLGAVQFARYVSNDAGLAGYEDPELAGVRVVGPRDHFAYHVSTMSALSMCVRMFATHDLSDPFLKSAAAQVIRDLPAVTKDRLSIDYYSWFWCTLALVGYDGPRLSDRAGKYWGPWNKALVEALLPLQDHAEKACTNGAWLTPDRWSEAGGPLTTTALAVLTLESYYRYDPLDAWPRRAHVARLGGASANAFLTTLKTVRDALANSDPALAAAFEDALAYVREVHHGINDPDAPAPDALRADLDGFGARDVLRLVEVRLEAAAESDLTWVRKRVRSGTGRGPCSAWLVDRWAGAENRTARAAAIAGAGAGFEPSRLRIDPEAALSDARAGCLDGLREILIGDPGRAGAIAARMSAHRLAVVRKLAEAGKGPEVLRAVGAQNRTERSAKAALERLADARTDAELWKRARVFDAALAELDRAGDEAAWRVGLAWTPEPPSSSAADQVPKSLADLRAQAARLGGRPHLERSAIASFLAAHPDVRVVPVAAGRVALLEAAGDGDGLLLAAELWCDVHWRIASHGD